MICALIMAGGKGERFWPLSTDKKPKQFLKLLGQETMIQMTVSRLEKLIPIERIFIVTGDRYIDLVKEQLPRLSEKNIIAEPVGRNTAPCIALSAFIIGKQYKDATIAVLPADHLINDKSEFINVLSAAYNFVEKNDDSVVTLGMKPDRPETGYGYIKCNEEKCKMNNFTIKNVDMFVEKPSLEMAKIYLKDENFLWNGGMFVWKVSTILNLTEKYLNATYNILKEIAITSEEGYKKALNNNYKLVDSVSVDYGIMENVENIYVIPCDFGWDDVGTWNSLERYKDKDENYNVSLGDVCSIKSSRNIIVAKDKPIVTVGLEDIFLIESDELILVGKKEQIVNIKLIKERVTNGNG